MGGIRSGLLGTEADARAGSNDDDVLGGGNPPGVLGGDDVIPLDDLQRMVTKVTKDWDPPSPRTTPAIVVGGATLQQAADQLNRLNEWGEGGGRLRTDRIPPGNSTKLTVNVHANLVRRLPTWSGYPKASAAAKAEWDQMVRKLAAHEDRHVAIAVEEADRLAQDLVGKEISDIVQLVTDANTRMQQRQDELDDPSNTDHGAKPGVQYGDVNLDTTVK
jgi:cell division septum initiation protein DivIVA